MVGKRNLNCTSFGGEKANFENGVLMTMIDRGHLNGIRALSGVPKA